MITATIRFQLTALACVVALVVPPEVVLRTAAATAAAAQTSTAPKPAQQSPAPSKPAQAPSKTVYLRNNDTWLTASDLKGPWSPAGKLPPSFAQLPANDDWKDVKANIPGRPPTAGAVPMVYASTSPAEMLLLQGAPVYQPVPGTSLLRVSNTDSDVFRFGKAGNFYYLVAGRWFGTRVQGLHDHGSFGHRR
jgi:hypothetical protein